MKIFFCFSEPRWNSESIPRGGKYDPNNIFFGLRMVQKKLKKNGHELFPINHLFKERVKGKNAIILPFDGMHHLKKNIRESKGIKKITHFFSEAPMVGMRFYSKRYQEKVFEYSDDVYVQDKSYLLPKFRNEEKLQVFRFPHAHQGIIDELFEKRNRKFLVAICANKAIGAKQIAGKIIRGISPLSNYGHWLYRKRSKLIHYLAQRSIIDVYGVGWDRRYLALSHYSYPLENDSWKGVAKGSKLPVLSDYDFCLCIENSRFPGYITEKIFDCFAVGTIPIYYGASDVTYFLPKDTFIDLSDFQSESELSSFLKNMNENDKNSYRQAMKMYLINTQEDPFSPEKYCNTIIRDVSLTSLN